MHVFYTAWEISVPPSFSGDFCLQDKSKRIIEWLGLEGSFRFCCCNNLTLLLLWRKKKNQICFYLFKNGLLRADEIVLVRCILWWICTYVWDLWGRNKDTFFWQALRLPLSWSIMFFFKDMKSKASCQRQLCVVAGLIFLGNFAMGYFEKYVDVEGAEQHICFTWMVANSKTDLCASIWFSSIGFWESQTLLCAHWDDIADSSY